MGVTQPFADLFEGFGLGGCADDFAMGFKHIVPVPKVLGGRLCCTKTGTPPIGKTLQSGTLGGCQSADGVFWAAVDDRRVLVVNWTRQ